MLEQKWHSSLQNMVYGVETTARKLAKLIEREREMKSC